MGASRPRVIISAAITLDGKIATARGDSGISSKQDAMRVHLLRAKTDAILVGKNTALLDNPLLNVRHVSGPNPVRVILDPLGEIPDKSNILRTADEIPTILVVTGGISAENLTRLSDFPVEIIRTRRHRISIKWLLGRLAARNIRSIMVEGGGSTNWEFVKHNLFDEVILMISPHLVGGSRAPTIVDGDGFARISRAARLNLVSSRRQGDEIVLHYVNNHS